MGSDNLISDHISLVLIILFGVTFAYIFRYTNIFGLWSFIIFIIIVIIAWILFF